VADEGLSFREAHHLVGRLLTEEDQFTRRNDDGLDPGAVARAARFGGGPGAPAPLDDLRHRRVAIAAELADRVRRWRRADIDLAAAVTDVISPVMAEAGRTG
jgi:hypothetical protein